MERFLRHTALFLILIVLMSISYEFILRGIPNNYTFKKRFLEENSKRIKVLALGNSHVLYGIDPQYFTLKGFNAAQVAQPFYYDYEILKKYNGKWDSLRYILLSVDYFSFYSEPYGEETRRKNYYIYNEISSSKRFLDNFEIVNNRPENYVRIVNYYFKDNYPYTITPLGMGTEYNFKFSQNLEITGRIAAVKHLAADYKYFDKNYKNLNSIINFAKKNNIKVLLVTFPTYKTYSNRLNNNQMNSTIKAIYEILKSHSNTRYFNFLSDSSFTPEDFYDADHLNNIGAKKLTIKTNDIIKDF